MKILVLHPGALGDIILSLPALHLLKRHMTGCRLTLSGNLDFVSPVSYGIADEVISFSSVPLHRLYTDSALQAQDLDFWASFDRVVSWSGYGEARFERQLKEIHPTAKIVPWKPVAGDRRHVSRIFADSLTPWIPDQEPLLPLHLHVRDEDLKSGNDWVEKRGNRTEGFLIAFHLGAGSATKCWPKSRFKSLARDLLRDSRVRLLLIEGPAEPDEASELIRALPGQRVWLARNLPLALLSGVLLRCDAYVGNDSGISHLAAALGVPSAVLFGPTDPRHWAPMGSHVKILRHTSGCVACEGRERLQHTCLESIAVEEVLAKLSELRC